MTESSPGIAAALSELSSPMVPDCPRVGVVLAAGHGKRIRSANSKMLHEIWGRPTVLRVASAVQRGLDSDNQVIVVGIKAEEVARISGARTGRSFAFQENLASGRAAGTGDAVRVALEAFQPSPHDRDIYVFPGDMGLLTDNVVKQFRRSFESTAGDMMMLTGTYSGSPETNYYGRIVRVPALDADGNSSGAAEGTVIEIKEHKDILGLAGDKPYTVGQNGRTYSFTRAELLELTEINTGVFAFKESVLRRYIPELDTANVQGEYMLTDLVRIFNSHGRTVCAVRAASEEEILAFNVKSVWHQMQHTARRWAYERLMDTITIADEEDFFLAEEVIEHILELDQRCGPLDIVIGKGVYLGSGVQLNRRVHISDRCHLTGEIILGEGVFLGPGVQLSTYPSQVMRIGDGVEILSRNILKGNLWLGAGTRIESGVLMTGSDTFPMRVGERVIVKGTTYLYGCRIDDDVLIEHSIVQCKRIEQVRRRDGSIQPIRYVLPPPEGLDSLTPVPRCNARRHR